MKPRTLTCAWLALVALSVACNGEPKQTAPAPAPEQVNTGRIRGVVKLRGSGPARRSQPVPKDTNVCGKNVPLTKLALGRDGGVKQAFVYLDGIENAEELRPAASLTVEQKGCEYAPHAMMLQAGSPLEIVNEDAILHNVHAKQMSENGLQTVFNIAQPIQGQRTKLDPRLKPGIVKLTCEAGHPWMTAYILVTNHAYAAVTDDNGEFVIDRVRPGTYPIKMWHEGVTLTRIIESLQQFEYEEPYETTEQVVVPPGGEARVNFEFSLRASNPKPSN